MKKGKEALRELYNFEGFSFRDICKVILVLIHLKKKGKTGICPICNKKRRKVIGTRIRKVRDVNFGNEKCFIVFEAYRIKCKCGYRSMEKLNFILPNEMITERFANSIFNLCEKMSL